MIKLENISKYYHNEGIINQALHKINLDFQLGEFVAITGESGSGKTTLLNVISGNDSYEEGELYIHGEETSYYNDEDWESYRREKIAFIFQNYNLIDSYTVLKNVEVALVIQGLSKAERRTKATNILQKVGLEKHLKQRASKLSGGEKQRLAIARALAKETKIIVADEPTGNLDSQSSKQVLKLLNDLASDKLIFIVTHNYEQVSQYVSRKIRLFDGEVVEDKKIRESSEVLDREAKDEEQNEILQAGTIAKFNIFGQPKKSIFAFFISFAIVFFIFMIYASMLPENSINIYRDSSINTYPERLLVVKQDQTSFTEVDYEFLNNDKRISKVLKDDSLIDGRLQMRIEDNNSYLNFYNQITFYPEITKDSLKGRLPVADFEILLQFHYNMYEEEDIEAILDQELIFLYSQQPKPSFGTEEPRLAEFKFKVVGVNYVQDNNKSGYYITDSTIKQMSLFIEFMNSFEKDLVVSQNGSQIKYKEVTYVFDKNLKGNDISLHLPSSFSSLKDYLDEIVLKISDQELNISAVEETYLNKVEVHLGAELLEKLITLEFWQASVNLRKTSDLKSIEKYLYQNGYYTLSPYYDELVYSFEGTLSAIVTIILSALLIFILFIVYLICYLIFRIILNTKIKDYTVLRIIGAKRSMIANIIRFELLFSFIVAYFLFLLTLPFIKKEFYFLNNLKLIDYFVVFIINVLMSFLIARRFINKQLQKTLYANLRAE